MTEEKPNNSLDLQTMTRNNRERSMAKKKVFTKRVKRRDAKNEFKNTINSLKSPDEETSLYKAKKFYKKTKGVLNKISGGNSSYSDPEIIQNVYNNMDNDKILHLITNSDNTDIDPLISAYLIVNGFSGEVEIIKNSLKDLNPKDEEFNIALHVVYSFLVKNKKQNTNENSSSDERFINEYKTENKLYSDNSWSILSDSFKD